jgi:hypothetical protein
MLGGKIMQLLSFFTIKKGNTEKLNPESKWVVGFVDGKIRTLDYEGVEKMLDINEIEQIIIETNDSGPWGTDIWWKIIGNKDLILVPGGATGESEMLDAFQKFSNFNNKEFIKAMSSVENAQFLCWIKK